ncbi:MAG: alpha/beta fold hydrolase [Deltaproteobacteria bacterium]|nr:alpha/beta fold hydrolase [Deltaproteobacteria bacterium]
MPSTPTTKAYRLLRDNLGSIRRVYLRGNRIVRRGDFAQHEETVLLLHGFFQTRNVWEIMEDRLRYDGFGVLSFDLGGLLWRFNTRSPEDLAALVTDKVERVCTRYDLDRVHVIGHSKGGLVARAWIEHHGGEGRAKSLITLGTAHHAPTAALLGIPATAWALATRTPFDRMPDSPVLNRLAEDDFPSTIPFVSIYSRADLVCPWPTSVLKPKPGETSMRNVALKGVGHTALTTDPAVYRVVREALLDATRLWKERQERSEPGEPKD